MSNFEGWLRLMGRVWILFCVTFSQASACSLSSPILVKGQVVRVIDGDSLFVAFTRKETLRLLNHPEIKNCLSGYQVRQIFKKNKASIRLASIDAPEFDQRFGQDSKKFLAWLIMQDNFLSFLIQDVDKYERFISNAYQKNRWLNQEMVRFGYAWVYTEYPHDPGLKGQEGIARENRLGLWQDQSPEEPWKWRRRKKK